MYACVHVYRGTHVCLRVCVHPCRDQIQLQLFFFGSHSSCFVRQGLLLIVDFAEYRGCLQQASDSPVSTSQQWDFKYIPPHKFLGECWDSKQIFMFMWQVLQGESYLSSSYTLKKMETKHFIAI